ncbi:PIN domain-containing protein [Sulfobacillus harzensis]|uniref:PIN domain-containing protein n=1 Tax=Sulfobacillus harzensis TaxID=2729629 RepID=A0A7Y0L7Q5_9FIRM|nr:PIN domain-containing protein [Sulfobacillus harzensis]NMP24517.1 PIN domain-containing protein [Sulfobacillus harzensis]
MPKSSPIRIFLDSSILRVFTLGNNALSSLVMLPLIGCPIEIVLSSYTLSETLEVLSRPNVPPKARIAVIQGLAFAILQGDWHVHLEDPDPAVVEAMGQYCRDEKDWPVLADAQAEACDFVLTYDHDLLEMGDESPIRCIDPETLGSIFENDPDIQTVVAQVEAEFKNLTPTS